MEQRLTEELIKTTIECIFSGIQEAWKYYYIGFTTEDERRLAMTQCFYENVDSLIRGNKLRLLITHENYPAFVGEYCEYLEGKGDSAPKHIPWLYDVSGEKCEATPADQRLFFELIKQLKLSPELYEPVPGNIPSPNYTQLHQYAFEGIYCTEFNCVDDGGLLSDAAPAGKTYRIRNELGLEAVFTVLKEDYYPKGTDSQTHLSLEAKGYIEGYTAHERTGNPEITLWVRKDGKIPWHLTFWQNRSDIDAFTAHPLWQEYFRWSKEKEAKRDLILSQLFESSK